MRRIVGPLLLALLLASALTGCGEKDDAAEVASLDGSGEGGSSDEDAEDSDEGEDKSAEDRAMEFASCMRENGVPDFPDPEVDEDGGGGLTFRRAEAGGKQPDRAAIDKAMKACEDLAPRGGGRFSEEDRSKMQDAFLEYAACMREKGIDMPDPDFSEGGGAFRMGGPGVDPDDPEFEKAHEACDDDLAEMGPRG